MLTKLNYNFLILINQIFVGISFGYISSKASIQARFGNIFIYPVVLIHFITFKINGSQFYIMFPKSKKYQRLEPLVSGGKVWLPPLMV